MRTEVVEGVLVDGTVVTKFGVWSNLWSSLAYSTVGGCFVVGGRAASVVFF